MGSCDVCDARSLDLGLVERRAVHLAKVDRLSLGWYWGAALFVVATGSTVLLANKWIESLCKEIDNQVAVSTPPPRRVGVGTRGRTRHSLPVGVHPVRAGKP